MACTLSTDTANMYINAFELYKLRLKFAGNYTCFGLGRQSVGKKMYGLKLLIKDERADFGWLLDSLDVSDVVRTKVLTVRLKILPDLREYFLGWAFLKGYRKNF